MFRPDDIGKIFGQDHIQEILLSWVEDLSKIPPSILFSGPYGTGKTTIARILAKYIAKSKKDLKEINAADNRGIDDVRLWIESTKFSPMGTGGKVYIIDELQQLTGVAQAALLKVIEEPPTGVYFFLCTTEPTKLIGPIRSRCTILDLKLFSLQDTCNLLSFAFNGKLPKHIVEAIHHKSGGHARDAVKMAELACVTNIRTVEELNSQVGLSCVEIEQLLIAILNRKVPWRAAIELFKIQDAQILDSVIDRAAMNQCEMVLKNYPLLLQVRLQRKEYKINLMEQVLHLLSICHPYMPT